MKNTNILLIIIIVFLAVALGVCGGILYTKLNEKNPVQTEENKSSNEQKNNNNNQDEAIRVLGNNEFVIDSIKEDNDKYQITAYVLNSTERVITKQEYNNLFSGKTLKFRNNEYKYISKDTNGIVEIGASTKLGNKSLVVICDNSDFCYLDNMAGATNHGLKDCSSTYVKFSVDKNVIIDSNKKSMTLEEIINDSSSGTDEECNLIIENNKIVNIQTQKK